MKNQSIVLPFVYGKMIIKDTEWWKRRVGEIDPEHPNRTFNGFIMLRAINACTFVGVRFAVAQSGRKFSFVAADRGIKENEDEQD